MVSPWRISFRYICRSRNCAPGWVRGYLSIQILSKEKDRNEQPSTEVGRLVLTALFLSGMTAIAYEILWQRLLVRTTGATLPAVSQIFCVWQLAQHPNSEKECCSFADLRVFGIDDCCFCNRNSVCIRRASFVRILACSSWNRSIADGSGS
jgi:hypothetical protein